jgi:hypothetical protein
VLGVPARVNVPRCSAFQRVESWPSLLVFGIQMPTVRFSASRLAAVTSRLALCRALFRVHTSSLEHRKGVDALRGAGADVVMNERAGSHGGAFWREVFPLMVAWAFG